MSTSNGPTIKVLRNSKGITQSDLATKVNNLSGGILKLHQSRIALFERVGTDNVPTLKLIAKALGVSLAKVSEVSDAPSKKVKR